MLQQLFLSFWPQLEDQVVLVALICTLETNSKVHVLEAIITKIEQQLGDIEGST